MQALEFACVLHELTDKLKIDMDSELVAKMFDIYEGSYENYTLLELIGLLCLQNIPIDCVWNKKAIIDMIKTKKLPVPKKYEPMEATTWEFYRVRKSLDIIETKYMLFCEGITIQMPTGTVYAVEAYITSELMDESDPDSWEKVAYIMLENMETGEEYQVEPDEFFEVLDNDDITILSDSARSYYANQELRDRWENHIRYM